MVVHDVEMHDIGAGSDDVGDLLAKFGEVGGKNTGGDSEGFGHDVCFKSRKNFILTIIGVAKQSNYAPAPQNKAMSCKIDWISYAGSTKLQRIIQNLGAIATLRIINL
jgi:hypothetical protein